MNQALKNHFLIAYSALFFLLGLVVIASGSMCIDEGIWNYIAKVWIEENIQPYVGTLDDKPPGIIILYTLKYLLFENGYFFIRFLGCICIYLTALFLYQIGKSLISQNCGVISALIFSLSMLWQCLNAPFLGQSEVFMILFSVTGFYFLLSFLLHIKNYFLVIAGFSFGVGLAFKQVAGLSILAAFLTISLIFNYKTSMSICLKLGALSLLSFFLLHMPIISTDNLFNYVKFAWLYPNYYETFFWRIPKFIEGFFTNKIVLFYPFLLLLIPRKICKISLLSKKFLIPWLICAFVGVNISGYYSGHQIIQILPILSLLAGLALNQITLNYKFRFYEIVFIVIFLFFPYETFVNNSASILSQAKTNSFSSSVKNHIEGFSDSKKLGKWFKQHTEDSDNLYFLGVATNVELCYSDRLSASKYFNEMRVLGERIEKKVVQDLIAKNPKFVGISKSVSNYRIIKEYVNDNYNLLFSRNNIKVFKSKAPNNN